jgi:polyhydroxyalkanoic acid synthase PhaR subunit
MAEEARGSSSLDQAEEIWKQWYDTSSKVWSNILAGARESYADPYGLYRSWLKAVEDGQTTGGAAVLDTGEIWKKWFETTGDIWRKFQETGTDPLGITTRWIEVMEEARSKLLSGVLIDPVTFFKQWYDSSNEIWSKALEEIIGTEKFVEATNRYIESYGTFFKTFRRLNEEYFSHLQLTTRADLARVAEIIIALENKVDGIQDAFEDLQGQFPHIATLDSIRTLATHLENLDGKLRQLPEALQKITTLDDLSQRLTTIEGRLGELPPTLQKLDTLQSIDQRLSGAEWHLGEIPAKLDAIQGLDQRLGSVEGKLDEMPSALQRLDAIQGLDQRLGGVEGRLDQIPPALARLDALQHIDERLGDIEGRLDQIPPALQKIDAVEGLNERLSTIESRSGELVPALQKLDAIQGLDQRLDGVEHKIDEMPAALQKNDAVQNLDQRINAVEDRLSELTDSLKKSNQGDATQALEKRLDGVESKLDRLLSLLEEKDKPAAKTPARRTTRAKTASQKKSKAENEDATS